jgi:4-amino-4-deoxy-L-arabinose transferase-like glycosyltransferase
MTETLAILALGTFVLAWTVQTIVVVEKKRNLGDVIANALFFAGLVLFTFYSFNIADPWFIVFNSAAAVLALVNLYYVPKKMLALKRDVTGIERFVEKEVAGYKQVYSHAHKKKRK